MSGRAAGSEKAAMRICWTYKSIPELAGLPAEQQRRLWREAHWKCFESWQMWMVPALYGLGGGLGSYFGLEAGWHIVGGVVGVTIIAIPASLISTAPVRRRLRAMRQTSVDK
jgi:hypothetical protein